MSRVYWVVAFAVALVVFGIVTDVFGVLYTLSTMPGWVQAGAAVRIILMLIWLVVIISDLMENK
jgi:hypothetical protein